MADPTPDRELVNTPLVKAWAQWALVWLTVFPFVGILVSIQFHNPEFLGGLPWFTFGRLRSVHLGGVLFGSFTTAFIGLLYYFVPRLCGAPLYKVEWGWWQSQSAILMAVKPRVENWNNQCLANDDGSL